METRSETVPREAKALAVLAFVVCLPPLIWWVTDTWQDTITGLVLGGPAIQQRQEAHQIRQPVSLSAVSGGAGLQLSYDHPECGRF